MTEDKKNMLNDSLNSSLMKNDEEMMKIDDESYYREKFPNFDEAVIQILAKCSKKKYYDEIEKSKLLRKSKEDYTDEDFIVKFS